MQSAEVNRTMTTVGRLAKPLPVMLFVSVARRPSCSRCGGWARSVDRARYDGVHQASPMHTVTTEAPRRRRRDHTSELKRELVARSLVPGASVAASRWKPASMPTSCSPGAARTWRQ